MGHYKRVKPVIHCLGNRCSIHKATTATIFKFKHVCKAHMGQNIELFLRKMRLRRLATIATTFVLKRWNFKIFVMKVAVY